MTAINFDFRGQMEFIANELMQFEESAGIRAAVERVNEGCFIPYGIDGEGAGLPQNQQSENYFDSEFDHQRRGIRNVYFGVADKETRKVLIKKSRVIDRTYLERDIKDKMRAMDLVAKAQTEFDKPSWTPVFFIVFISAALGIWKSGSTGLFLCALGLFFAFFYRRDQAHKLLWELNQAKDELLIAAENGEEDYRFRPQRFSQSEEMTGERDDSFDALGAAWLRALSRKNRNS